MPDVAGLIADHHLGLSHDVGALGRCEKMRRQNPEPKNAPAEAHDMAMKPGIYSKLYCRNTQHADPQKRRADGSCLLKLRVFLLLSDGLALGMTRPRMLCAPALCGRP